MPVAEGRVVSGNFLDNGAEETGDSPLSETHKPVSGEVDLLHNGGPPSGGGGESILDIFGNGPSSPGLVSNPKPTAPSGHSGPAAPASNALLDLLSDLTGPADQSNTSVSPTTVPSQTGSNSVALKNSNSLGLFDGLGSGGPTGSEGEDVGQVVLRLSNKNTWRTCYDLSLVNDKFCALRGHNSQIRAAIKKMLHGHI